MNDAPKLSSEKAFRWYACLFFFCHEADLSSISELLAMLFYLLLQRTSILLNFKGNVLTNEFQSFPCQAK